MRRTILIVWTLCGIIFVTVGASAADFALNINSKELFKLHTINDEKRGCDGADTDTWDFVPVIENTDSVKNLGFCIQKNQNAAKSFHEAQITCMSMAKPARLPEPMEWKLACKQEYANKTNGKNIGYINDYEWASNVPMFSAAGPVIHPLYAISRGELPGTEPQGIAVTIMGDGGCKYSSWGWICNNNTGMGDGNCKLDTNYGMWACNNDNADCVWNDDNKIWDCNNDNNPVKKDNYYPSEIQNVEMTPRSFRCVR